MQLSTRSWTRWSCFCVTTTTLTCRASWTTTARAANFRSASPSSATSPKSRGCWPASATSSRCRALRPRPPALPPPAAHPRRPGPPTTTSRAAPARSGRCVCSVVVRFDDYSDLEYPPRQTRCRCPSASRISSFSKTSSTTSQQQAARYPSLNVQWRSWTQRKTNPSCWRYN